jgi:hypothetical protein
MINTISIGAFALNAFSIGAFALNTISIGAFDIPGMNLYEKETSIQLSSESFFSKASFLWETQIPQFCIVTAGFFYLYFAYLGTYKGLETIHNLYKLVCYNYNPSRYPIKQKRLRHRLLNSYCSFKNIHSESIEKLFKEKMSYDFDIKLSYRFFKSFEFITAESLIGLFDLYSITSEPYVKNLTKIKAKNLVENYLSIYKNVPNRFEAAISLKIRILQNLCSTYINIYEIMKIVETSIDISFNEIVFRLDDEFDIYNMEKVFWQEGMKINYDALKKFQYYFISKSI